jgi:hypothetical protein
LKYRDGYKYQLADHETFQTEICPVRDIVTPRIWLTVDGTLTVRDGYAWDGTSGPVIDRKTNQRASLAHDALYQLMRMKRLPHNRWRDADREFAKILKQDGAWKITRQIDMAGLKLAHGRAALPKNRKRIHEAP